MTDHDCPPPATPRPEETLLREAVTAWIAASMRLSVPADEIAASVLTLVDELAPSGPKEPKTEAGRVRSPQYSAWLPIATAPKDGTYVVLFGTLASDTRNLVQPQRACVSRWCEKPEDSPFWVAGWPFAAPGYSDAFEPTHWMPLPTQAASLRPQAGLEASSAGSPSDLATIESLESEVATLRSTHATLQSALRLYGQHFKLCPARHVREDGPYAPLRVGGPCGCGFHAALNGAPGTEA